jgi:cysteinyl-tRNA synthetase
MQKEVSAASLQAKWQRLQRSTGNFIQVKRLVEAAENPDQRLVLVQTEFNRLTDNLFVILDANNLITGVDFPIDPNPLRGGS